VAQGKASDAKLASADATRLEIVRIFDAPRALVYEAWTTPEHLNHWSAPKGFVIPEASMDFRVGGKWYCHMRSPDGGDHRAHGVYREIVENERLTMTHSWLSEDSDRSAETIVTVTFEDHGNKTKMTFLQEGFTSLTERDGHAEGWDECFDLLSVLLEKQRGGHEIVVSRLVNAPRDLVFLAFKDPEHITHWWGPNGFKTTTYEMDFREGGLWLFTMHGPDGTDYPNRVRYTEISEPELIAYDHDGGESGDPLFAFKQSISFEVEGRKTRVTLRLVMATPDQRAKLAKFGAVEGADQTLSRLNAFLASGGSTQ
jgi:uncharacterized protein YndB with AHSA1/START domain